MEKEEGKGDCGRPSAPPLWTTNPPPPWRASQREIPIKNDFKSDFFRGMPLDIISRVLGKLPEEADKREEGGGGASLTNSCLPLPPAADIGCGSFQIVTGGPKEEEEADFIPRLLGKLPEEADKRERGGGASLTNFSPPLPPAADIGCGSGDPKEKEDVLIDKEEEEEEESASEEEDILRDDSPPMPKEYWNRYFQQIEESEDFDVDDFPGRADDNLLGPLGSPYDDDQSVNIGRHAINRYNTRKKKMGSAPPPPPSSPPFKIFIGYDPREHAAYEVCRHSLLKHSSTPLDIRPIKQSDLRLAGHYWRERGPTESTEFSFTRFLTPFLSGFHSWAMFVDCDFLYTDDVAELASLADDRYAVMCVHHAYRPKETTKMDGTVQTVYPRKNWSSMVLYNCAHPKNALLTPDLVSKETGAFLHRFTWLDDGEIGEVPFVWNFLVGHNKVDERDVEGTYPKAIHYTMGGPWFERYKDCEFANLWLKELEEYESEKKKKMKMKMKQ